MTTDTSNRIAAKLAESPILRASSLPELAEIDKASQAIGVPFAEDYREFLLKFGGAMVGAFPIYGLRPVEVMGDDEWSVVGVTLRYRADNVPECTGWAVVSSDHSGNPVGMDSSGAIWIHDHDLGGITPLAKSFEEYIRVHCLNLPSNS